MAAEPHFDRALFSFLRDLKNNNTRDWFQANKHRYENEVRGPMLRFVEDFGPRLAKISPAFVADARKSGGSLFRIYRDVRFSKDKTPYKTNAGAQFRHIRARDAHAPGFYLHLEPGGAFMASGLWHPDAPTLAKIRGAIVADPARWKRITGARALRAAARFAGDALVRPPRGFDPGHPLIEDLKRKDFIVLADVTEAAATAPGFIDVFARFCRTAAPYTRFLAEAAGLEW